MKLKYINSIFFLSLFILNISFISLFYEVTTLYWLIAMCSILIFPQIIVKEGKNTEMMYLSVLLIGLIFHTQISGIKFPVMDALRWMVIVCVLIVGRSFKSPRYYFLLIIGFLLIHSSVAILEYIFQTNFVDYTFVQEFSDMYQSSFQFRAFGLMQHPLYAANVSLIIMSFILINNNLNKTLRILSLVIGSLGLLAFNSRGAIIIWLIILLYKIFLYNRKTYVIAIIASLGYILFINDFFALIIQQSGGVLGRLAEKDSLKDDSALARLISVDTFFKQKWSFEDAFFGGRVIFIPGTNLSLENGFLLTIAWWGWVIGLLKVGLELMISWTCLSNYSVKDRLIVFAATWGCAYMNNNTIQTFVFAFFVVSFLSIGRISSKIQEETLGEYNFNRKKIGRITNI